MRSAEWSKQGETNESDINLLGMEQPMTPPKTLPPPASESTDLERRVLAHERVLQALIAFMARTEPRFIDHLSARFVEPMRMAKHEHDHRETDDYAEEFIRAVMLIGETVPHKIKEQKVSDKHRSTPGQDKDEYVSTARPVRRSGVQVRERHGIWQVTVDGKFHGDYHQKEHALAAAALVKLSIG